MLKIRLKRLGRKKQPSYRIIVIDSRKRRDGKALEEVGFYNPINNQTKLKTLQIQKRINEGAQMTKTVKNILAKTINN
ncbi:30S ribosomal protein S16 (plastid) [Chondrus crispus]|uniref:30S ribosomal protein S16 n=1 Tax=Chondrus crispus TaxID=2769 RepID=M5DDD6_CHOCR|nr:30S ribosomal protein S16 [Chondrus crispus]CCP38074.1 30S ribosomal protein S16 [Chondrus crispus]|eukprot:YP_007627327.1 30S ribosomal protein S16 (plastid) [Chondrus crispus]